MVSLYACVLIKDFLFVHILVYIWYMY